MPRPRGVNTRLFSQRSRAVVLEAEWMVMPQRIANELKPLVKLANDQGWRVEAARDSTKLVWRGPNGEGPVYTGYRCQGRDLANYRAELVRNGLKLDEGQAKEHVEAQQANKILEAADDIDLDKIHEAMTYLMGCVGQMHVKAQLFDQARQDAKAWEDLVNEAQTELEKAVAKLSEANTMIDAIRECFSMAPWAILPAIAQLLGIDANGPSIHLAPTVKEAQSG